MGIVSEYQHAMNACYEGALADFGRVLRDCSWRIDFPFSTAVALHFRICLLRIKRAAQTCDVPEQLAREIDAVYLGECDRDQPGKADLDDVQNELCEALEGFIMPYIEGPA